MPGFKPLKKSREKQRNTKGIMPSVEKKGRKITQPHSPQIIGADLVNPQVENVDAVRPVITGAVPHGCFSDSLNKLEEPKAQGQIKAFISYQKKEKEFVKIIAECLVENSVDVFYDKWDIQGGDSIPLELERGINESSLFIYILSSSSVKSKWVQQEYHSFLWRKINNHVLRIIPLLRKDCEAPPFIAPLRYIDFRNFSLSDPKHRNPSNDGPLKELLNAIFRKSSKPPIGSIHPAMASYEFYYRYKDYLTESDGLKYFEFGFKNLTDSPLINFDFTIRFRVSVEDVKYDYERSTANMWGGKGLVDDGKTYNWNCNQIMENEGWVVFTFKSRDVPSIKSISTKLVGRVHGSNEIIEPNPGGIKV